jgi:hypothetical protein
MDSCAGSSSGSNQQQQHCCLRHRSAAGIAGSSSSSAQAAAAAEPDGDSVDEKEGGVAGMAFKESWQEVRCLLLLLLLLVLASNSFPCMQAAELLRTVLALRLHSCQSMFACCLQR